MEKAWLVEYYEAYIGVRPDGTTGECYRFKTATVSGDTIEDVAREAAHFGEHVRAIRWVSDYLPE